MRYSKKRKEQKTVIGLYRQNFTQKEIAKQIGITEKTAASWLKDYKELVLEVKSKIRHLDKRLELMLENPDTPSQDIRNITLSITELENRLNNN